MEMQKKNLAYYIGRIYSLTKYHGVQHMLFKAYHRCLFEWQSRFMFRRKTELPKLSYGHEIIKRKQVFIFTGVPYQDIGGGQRAAQLAKTFTRSGYAVYYIFAYHSHKAEKSHLPVLAVRHEHIANYEISHLIGDLRQDPLFIFEIAHKNFQPFLEIAQMLNIKTVYDHIDNWETSLGEMFYDKDIFGNFVFNVDVVTATSRPLKEQLELFIKERWGQHNKTIKQVHYCPNALDAELFDSRVGKYGKPKDLVLGEKTLLYYGTLWGDWFDWELLHAVAQKCPEISINLIGDCHNLEVKSLNVEKNIHFLGSKKQTELPAYLQYSDIAILPFKNDEIGRYVSPLKIFEYIGMQKPVIACGLPDIMGYPNVFIADDSDAWVGLIKSDIKIKMRDVSAFVNANSWHARADQILDLTAGEPAVVNTKISVIVLNHNNLGIVRQNIESLLAYNALYGYEIIVVDNQSDDGSYEMLQEKYADQIILRRNPVNGCSSGRNLGVEAATGDILVFLDSDQWVTGAQWLHPALEIMERNLNIGAVGWAGGWFEKGSLAGIITEYLPERGISPIDMYRTDIGYLGSGGMVVRRCIFELTGGFDHNYDPTCYEDTDFSLRIKHAGFNLAYCPHLGIRHLPHQTTNSGSFEHNMLLEKNGRYFSDIWKKRNPDLLKCYFRG